MPWGIHRRCRCLGGILFLVLLCLGPGAACAQVTIQWFGFERPAIPDTYASPVAYSAQINGTYDSVRMDLASGGSLPLTDSGGGLWTTSVAAPDLLFGYTAADANHNFVGYLRVFLGTTQLIALNTFINVVDSSVAPVTPQAVGANTLSTDHAVNIWKPDLSFPPPIGDIYAIAQQFYQDFPDDFDFLNIVFSLPSYQSNRFHRLVKNEVLGIGLSVFDGSAIYGSAGRLKGINQYPIDIFFDLAETASLHEMGHQWINFSSYSVLQPGAHWPPGTQARGIMGYGTSQGLAFPYDLVDLGGGTFQMASAPRLREFTDLDLYYMGLVGPADVDSNFVFSNPAQPICNGCSGPVTWFTVDDVIAAQGPRVPDVASSPKEFRAATIVVTRDRFLDATELSMFNHFALRGESTVALPFSAGFDIGTTLPFYLATGGRGTLVTTVSPSAVDAPVVPAAERPGLRLLPGLPNPFRDQTEIRFELATRQVVSLRVHDVAGRRVRALADGDRPAGLSAVRWDGRDDAGALVPSGVYFYRLETADGVVTRRTTVLR